MITNNMTDTFEIWVTYEEKQRQNSENSKNSWLYKILQETTVNTDNNKQTWSMEMTIIIRERRLGRCTKQNLQENKIKILQRIRLGK